MTITGAAARRPAATLPPPQAVRVGALSGRALLALLLKESEVFSIPPMVLVSGEVLDTYRRFPRSNERGLLVDARTLSAADIGQVADFYFVSHRW
jgi:hypothetical protein